MPNQATPVPSVTSATPLIALKGVVLDTETTGLDTGRARLLQIGALKVTGIKIDDGKRFERLVNPGVPIPAASSAVHGIFDADVAGKPATASVLPELEAFIGDAVVIGHSIGFDLAILRRESVLAARKWRGPRWLDIGLLAELAAPALEDYSLDHLSDWLGIEIEGRHSAMGDARATAEIFTALVPLLRRRSIRTFKEAQTASRDLANRRDELPRDALARDAAAPDEPGPPPADLSTLFTTDSFPYRRRVEEVMSAPPVVAGPDTKLRSAISMFLEKNVSSVFVRSKDGTTGIVTERDALRAIDRLGEAGLDANLGSVMTSPMQTISRDAFVYRAIGRMDRLGFRHLGVHDDSGAIVGAITTRNLLRHRASSAMILGDEIESASDVAALGAAWAGLPLVARKLLADDSDPRTICAIISSEICMLTAKAAQMAQARMSDAGHGSPPVPYCVLVLGSAGRGESLLAADQDNAIVFASGAPGGPEDKWFEALGGHIADILDEVGVPYCKGGVMAKNELWRRSLAGWRGIVDTWVRRQRPEDLLNVDIFYDALPVHGDRALGETVWSYAYERGHEAPGFIQLLSELLRDWKPPLTMFGNIRKDEDGRVNLKRAGLLPIFTAARVLSIKTGARSRSTPDRLRGALGAGVGAAVDIENAIDAHRIILGAMLAQQLIDTEKGLPLSARVDLASLGAREPALRSALGKISAVIDIAREGMM